MLLYLPSGVAVQKSSIRYYDHMWYSLGSYHHVMQINLFVLINSS